MLQALPMLRDVYVVLYKKLYKYHRVFSKSMVYYKFKWEWPSITGKKSFFGVGNIYRHGINTITYRASSLKFSSGYCTLLVSTLY